MNNNREDIAAKLVEKAVRRYHTVNGAIPPGTFVFAIDSLSTRHNDLTVFCQYLKALTESKY